MKEVFRKLGWLTQQSRKEAELRDELQFHLQEEAEEREAAGLAPAHAKSAARRELGNIALVMEDSRAAWGWTPLERLWQDLRYAARMLRKNPGFTGAAVLSLALGIGANTAMFTMVNAILLNPLPFPSPNRLVMLWTVPLAHPNDTATASVPEYFAWKRQARSFESMGTIQFNSRDLGASENGAAAERVNGETLAAEIFEILEVKPMLGRPFTRDENQIEAAAPVVLISHRLWERRYGADPNILGRTIRMDGAAKTVIGVMPPGFTFLTDEADYWAPSNMNRSQLLGSARGFRVAARLKPGVTMRQAQNEMDSIAAQVAKDFPKSNQGWGVRVQSLHDSLYGEFRQPLMILEGVVAFVLLIACANVAALLLARATARKTEVALRAAIGAGRGRMIRQFLVESVLLALAGGVAGVFVAWAGIRLLIPISPSWFPRLHDLTINTRVLAFTTFVSLLTGLIFGIFPALKASPPDLVESLKESSRNAMDGSPGHRLRGGLVVLQIALALILLIGSGLLINSFLRLRANDLGADPRGLLTFQYRLPAGRYQKGIGSYNGYPLIEVSPEPALIFTRVLEKLQRLPEAQSAAGVNHTPLNGEWFSRTFTIEGKQGLTEGLSGGASEVPSAAYFMVTPNYFSTMKIPLLRGRDINAQDTVSSPWVVIINETMARRFWPNEDPLGKRLTVDLVQDEQPREVIAVARDSRLDAHQQASLPVMYVAYNQQPPHNRGPFGGERLNMSFVLRPAAGLTKDPTSDPATLVSALRRTVAEVDPNQPVADIQTVERNLMQQVEEPRYWMMLLGGFAVAATLLAAAGIYGVMSYTVAQRTREIGLRVALGASRREVIRMMIRRAVILVVTGLAVGLAGSFGLTRLMTSLLWGVKATDPLTFTVVTLVLAAVSLLACVLPTRRAVLVDPTVALRHE